MLIFIMSGCQSTKKRPTLQTHVHKIRSKIVSKGKFYSLSYSIAAALQHTTGLKVYELNKAIEDEKVTAKTLGTVYEQATFFYFLNRKRNSSSYGIANTINIIQVERNISVLDFAIAYLNSSQNENRNLIRIEQKRRIEQKIIFTVTEIYFKIALAQCVIEESKKVLLKCQKMEKNLVKLLESKKISPLRLLDERKRFIRFEKRLMLYRRKHQNACREFRIMLGLVKNKKDVDSKCLEKLSIPTLADINILEKTALLERPELQQFKTTIIINDARKTILKMTPIKLVNAYALKKSIRSFIFSYWREIAISTTYNLLRLPQKLASYRALPSKKDDISIRKLALSLGVIAQVRMAYLSAMQAKDSYDLDEKSYQACKKHPVPSGALSKLDLASYKLKKDEKFIKRLISMCDYYIAYYRLLNVLGVNSLDSANMKIIMNKIKHSKTKEKAKPLDKAVIKRYIKISDKLIRHSKSNTLIRSI